MKVNHTLKSLGLLLIIGTSNGTFASTPNATVAMEGSSGRGGGDPLALEFEATAEAAFKNLQTLKGAPFSLVNFATLQDKINTAQVLVADNQLPISQGGVIQNSAAVNQPGQNLIILNRVAYTNIGNASVKQALALHEFLSLAGLESTGNYPISSQYLIAQQGGTSTIANQSIDQASKSISVTTPCPEPSADALTLFSMLVDPNVSAKAVQSFLVNHIVARDALNDQCETPLDVSIQGNRQDDFQVLYSRYPTDLSALEQPKGDSIYSYTLAHGTSEFLTFVKAEATSSGQKLNLSPVLSTAGYSDQKYNAGMTDLMIAAENNSNVSVIQALIQAGSKVSARDTDQGLTVLMYAAAENTSVSILQALIQNGANINDTTNQGNTVLMYAAASNTNPAIVQALIQDGLSVNASDRQGLTALQNAASSNSNPAVLLALIQAGANVNAADSDGDTALILAAGGFQHNLLMVQALIQAGANVNTVGGNGNTALINAAFPANEGLYDQGPFAYDEPIQDQVIEVLLKAGADLAPQTIVGSTALDIARKYDAPQSMITLLGGS